uniref:Uncharacterized protein n=1 Tax=Oryza glumipatula TaxID=40148 RepID=A0A0D9YCB5_9ORYZ
MIQMMTIFSSLGTKEMIIGAILSNNNNNKMKLSRKIHGGKIIRWVCKKKNDVMIRARNILEN